MEGKAAILNIDRCGEDILTFNSEHQGSLVVLIQLIFTKVTATLVDHTHDSMSAEKNTIYVGGFFSDAVTEDVLYEVFSSFGEIRSVRLLSTDTAKYAYIRFQTVQEATYAIDNMNLNEFYGDILRCNFAIIT